MRWAGSIGGICKAMFSFEKYRRHFLLQFLLDVCIIGIVTIFAVFTVWNQQKWDDKYWFWLVFTFLSYGVIRGIILFVWLAKSVALCHIRLISIIIVNLVLLGSLIFATLSITMLGISGITPEGTEHRY